MRPCCPPPKASQRDRDSYHYPPAPWECPRCNAYPFDPDEGCGYCGLGRAYEVPHGLDPACEIAQGWASAWPNGSPPTDDQVQQFVKQHGTRCARCWRYRRWRRRPIHWLRRKLVAFASSPTPHHDNKED